MDSATALRELDESIRERSILKHPFYRAWERGELTREQLATYAGIYYPHVRAFPRYLAVAITHARTAVPGGRPKPRSAPIESPPSRSARRSRVDTLGSVGGW